MPGAGLPSDFDPKTQSELPDVFSFRSVDTAVGTFGYVRIWTFDVDQHRRLLQEFLRILSLLPSEGIILDVRGNGGGSIIAGEAMLQVLTPRRITPESFHFLSTPLMSELTHKLDDLKPWTESMERAVATGDLYSQGFPLASPDWYNLAGQRYHGRVALIVDALCYSTTDIVAAGFQDHDIGVILGTSTQTGAGGANVWDLDDLRAAFDPDPARFPTLPDKATFRVAVRRCTRVGPHSGDPLEDLGVAIPPENVYPMTKKDHVPEKPGDENKGLIEFAARKLLEGYDLELMSSVIVGSRIPDKGNTLIIVAILDHVLHFRIFDSNGKMVVDTDEKSVIDQATQIEALRSQLESFWPPHELTPSEKVQVIAAVTSLVGQTLQEPSAYVLSAEAEQVSTSAGAEEVSTPGASGKSDKLHIRLSVTTKNLFRLDTLLDDRQWDTRNLTLEEHVTSYTLPYDAPPVGWIELRGFTSAGNLAAAYKLRVGPPRPFNPAPS